MSPKLEIKFYEAERFAELKDMWEALENGKDMTVFQRYFWYQGLNRQYLKGCYGLGEKAVFAVAFKDGKAAMIAPLHIKKYGREYKGIGTAKGIYIIGEGGFTDYLNFIYNEFDEECADEITAQASNKFEINSFYFRSVIKGNSFETYLSEKYGESKTSETVCVQVQPRGSFDEYCKSLSKHSRQNIRTAFNRENKADIEVHIEQFGKMPQKDAEEFFSIYLKRSVSKNGLNPKQDGIKKTVLKYINKRYNDRLKARLAVYNYIIHSMVNNDDSYTIGIYSGEKKIGFLYGIMERGRVWRVIIVCFDEDYKFYTPGITAFYRYFRDILYADGKADLITDISKGTEYYKYEIGGTEHYLVNYYLRLHSKNTEESNVNN